MCETIDCTRSEALVRLTFAEQAGVSELAGMVAGVSAAYCVGVAQADASSVADKKLAATAPLVPV
tara:strand:- start:130 stop:324 length:195 start_codon:yes stop_codon:yes gene_type:complete